MKTQSDNQQILSFDKIKASNGTYSCLVENNLGKVIKTFQVIIEVKPRITSKFEPISITSTQSVNVICKASGASPQYQWSLDGRVISHSDQLTIDSTLHSGVLMCTASNEAGYDTVKFKLTVAKPPQSTSPNGANRTEIYLTEGDDTELNCPIENFDNIEWFECSLDLEGKIEKYDSSSDSTTHMRLTKVSLDDTDKYFCLGSNSQGSVSHLFELNVQPKPTTKPTPMTTLRPSRRTTEKSTTELPRKSETTTEKNAETEVEAAENNTQQRSNLVNADQPNGKHVEKEDEKRKFDKTEREDTTEVVTPESDVELNDCKKCASKKAYSCCDHGDFIMWNDAPWWTGLRRQNSHKHRPCKSLTDHMKHKIIGTLRRRVIEEESVIFEPNEADVKE